MILLRISCNIGGCEKKETVDFDDESGTTTESDDFETLLRDIADTLGLHHQSTTRISNLYELRTLKGGYAVRKTSQLKDEDELVLNQIVVDVEKADEKQRRRRHSRREANDATLPVKLEPREEEGEEEEEGSEISDERESTGTDNSVSLKREENEEEEEDGDEEDVTDWRNHQPESELLKQGDDGEPKVSNMIIEPTTTTSHVNQGEKVVGQQFKEDDEEEAQTVGGAAAAIGPEIIKIEDDQDEDDDDDGGILEVFQLPPREEIKVEETTSTSRDMTTATTTRQKDEEDQRQEAAARPGSSQEQTTGPRQRTKRQTQPPTVTPERRKRAKKWRQPEEEGEYEAPNEEEESNDDEDDNEDEDDETYRQDTADSDDSEKEGQNPQMRMVDEVNRDGRPLGTRPQHPARQTQAARRPNRKESAETTTTKGDHNNNNNKKSPAAQVAITMLPRSRENALKEERPELTWVIGVDEAGRGPLAGPVVAAAAIVPYTLAGVNDSKKITNEIRREQLYEEIVTSPGVSWAVAVVDAKRIDEINILQATMQAMSMAVSALVVTLNNNGDEGATAASSDQWQWDEAIKQPVCASRQGCYVTCGGTKPRPPQQQQPVMMISNANDDDDLTPAIKQEDEQKKETSSSEVVVDDPSLLLSSYSSSSYFALIGGNRTPRDLPCDSEYIVKGNTKEYSIAAASILAKVTRDRLMHQYDKLYPVYNLGTHKGYPTKEHKEAVLEHGVSPIHRRTFAPLKHMEFDDSGRVISQERWPVKLTATLTVGDEDTEAGEVEEMVDIHPLTNPSLNKRLNGDWKRTITQKTNQLKGALSRSLDQKLRAQGLGRAHPSGQIDEGLTEIDTLSSLRVILSEMGTHSRHQGYNLFLVLALRHYLDFHNQYHNGFTRTSRRGLIRIIEGEHSQWITRHRAGNGGNDPLLMVKYTLRFVLPE